MPYFQNINLDKKLYSNLNFKNHSLFPRGNSEYTKLFTGSII